LTSFQTFLARLEARVQAGAGVSRWAGVLAASGSRKFWERILQ